MRHASSRQARVLRLVLRVGDGRGGDCCAGDGDGDAASGREATPLRLARTLATSTGESQGPE